MPRLNVISSGTAGSGPTLVFLHYFGGSAGSWSRVTSILSQHRCLAVDLPGSGASPDLPDFDIAGVADAVALTLREHGIGRHVLIGHSMGGKIALALGAREGVAGLALIAPSPPGPEPMSKTKRAEMLAAQGDRRAAVQTVTAIAGARLGRAAIEEQVEDALKVTQAAWRWWVEAGSREDITAGTAGIDAPILVVSGRDDPVITPDIVRDEILPCLPSADHVSIEGTGHLVPLESPSELCTLLSAFLTKLG